MDIVIIAAVAEDGTIGVDGEMPWHYPADMQHFREVTMGSPVIMGRTTWESLPTDRRPLDGRTNIVLSFEEMDLPGEAVNVHGIDAAVDAAEATGSDAAYVMGGASVYEQFLGRADRMVLTEIPGAPDGDTFFPDRDDDAWREVNREEQGELAFVTYARG
ncbi:MAG: dihydrofolate reductase [Candidatus Nanohaloarchaea archaeon]